MRTRQNRMNGGIIGKEDYLEMNNLISMNQNYNRNIGSYSPGITVYPYTRPTEWRSLPSMTQGDQRLSGVFAVYDNDSNFVAFTISGNYTVDWGDGTTSAHTAATTAYKRYDRTTYAGLTSSVYNDYKNLVIDVRPTGSASFTSINLAVKHNQTNLPNYKQQWLDLRVAGATLSSLTLGTDNDSACHLAMLKEFEFVGTNVITNMGAMFANASGLVRVKSLHTNSATSMYRMFWQNIVLQEVPLFNTANVTNMESMFQTCPYIKYIPPFNTSRVTNFSGMFSGCGMLMVIPTFNTENATTLANMFNQCYNLRYIPWMDTRKVTAMNGMFAGCHCLRRIPFLNTSNVTNMSSMFAECSSLEEIPPLDFSKNTNFTFTFGSCTRLQKLPILNTTTALTSTYLMFAYGCRIREVTFADTTNVTNFGGTFVYCWNLTKINGFDTRNATSLDGTFSQCYQLEEVPFLRFDNLVNASNVFYGCRIKNFGNTYFSLPKATTLYGFMRYNGVVEEVPPIDAPNALGMQFAFQNCYNLKRLQGLTLATGASLASFEAAGFNNTFENCTSLQIVPRLNLSGMSAAALTGVFTNMFSGCRSISSLSGSTGINYNISVASLKLSGTALNEIYSGLQTVGASGAGVRTITVTSNWGAATDDPSIAIAKGWTVTG